jgi:small subunit ribosomal protein S6
VRDYELMVVFDPNIDEAAMDAVNQRVAAIVGQRGGGVDSVEPWGRRRLAYPIARHRDGVYVLTHFHADAGTAAELERVLKLSESVIRHLLVRREASASAAPAPAPAAA